LIRVKQVKGFEKGGGREGERMYLAFEE